MDPFFLLALIGGLLAIDERAGWQSLLAQPIFASLLVGFATGQLVVALPVGLVLELVWLSIMPMRGSRRPDQVLGSVVGTGIACLLASLAADPRAVLIGAVGAVLGLVVGEVGGRVTNVLFNRLGRMLGRMDVAAGTTATASKLGVLHAGSLAYVFVVEAAAVFLALKLGYAVAEWLTGLAPGSMSAAALQWMLLVPAIGAAAILQTYWRQPLRRILVLSSVMVILVLWLR